VPQPILYVSITNHGFGHATRTAEVVEEIQRRCPEMLMILATTAPRWLLESYISGNFIHRPRGVDVGVVQPDSLTMDRVATLEKLRQIRTQANALIAGEATFIRQNRVGLVLADIPPLATAIAHAANVPCWMASNFGWDFIYRQWGGEFHDMADWIGECFGQCDRLFRLPFHEPMSAFPAIEDVGLTGGRPRYEAADVRQRLNLPTPEGKTVLLTFGGLGLAQIPYNNVTNFPDWQFLTVDRHAPDWPNLVKVDAAIFRPVDLMPLCDRVISKPGYGTFSEACRLGVPLISLTRNDFAEAALLLDGIQNYSSHRILPPADFFQSNWEFLHEPMLPPRKQEAIATNGNEAIAQAVIDYFS